MADLAHSSESFSAKLWVSKLPLKARGTQIKLTILKVEKLQKLQKCYTIFLGKYANSEIPSKNTFWKKRLNFFQPIRNLVEIIYKVPVVCKRNLCSRFLLKLKSI